jgi:RecA-family ATPase
VDRRYISALRTRPTKFTAGLEPILGHLKVRFSDLVAAGFKLLSYAGKDAVLGELQRNGHINPTPLFERLYKDACALHPKLIAIDAVSDVFLGDEIKRDQVRQFGALMRRLAIDARCGLVMASHPSLTGINTGTGLSGSTQWHNTVRARIYFRKAGADGSDSGDEDKADNGLRVLEFKKNQYGPLSESLQLHWKETGCGSGCRRPACSKPQPTSRRPTTCS